MEPKLQNNDEAMEKSLIKELLINSNSKTRIAVSNARELAAKNTAKIERSKPPTIGEKVFLEYAR